MEIAALGPVAVNDLRERANVTDANLGYTVRRLVALGLVRRWRNPAHRDRYQVSLDDRHPCAKQICKFAEAVWSANGQSWTLSPPPSHDLAVDEGPNVRALRLFGRRPGHVEMLLGHPNRTLALLILGALGACDPTTIARVVGVRTDGDMLRLMDPLEADAVVVSARFGSIRLYTLAEAPWTSAFRALARAVVAQDPQLAETAAIASTLMLPAASRTASISGESSESKGCRTVSPTGLANMRNSCTTPTE
ncbi:MAG TPA: helix-turn-helix domain-containing protein [Candidatus Elarobacter sp.]|nr:helix-turn-helix domain-containing protein [Candidatus Elarobacter sp.]